MLLHSGRSLPCSYSSALASIVELTQSRVYVKHMCCSLCFWTLASYHSCTVILYSCKCVSIQAIAVAKAAREAGMDFTGRYQRRNVRERHVVLCGSVTPDNLRATLRELFHADHGLLELK
jgi:hypothetical protein